MFSEPRQHITPTVFMIVLIEVIYLFYESLDFDFLLLSHLMHLVATLFQYFVFQI